MNISYNESVIVNFNDMRMYQKNISDCVYYILREDSSICT